MRAPAARPGATDDLLEALRAGGGALVVATLDGDLLFATQEAHRLLGENPADVLWGRSPGLVGTAGSEAGFRLVSYLIEGPPDDELLLTGDEGPSVFEETGRFAPLRLDAAAQTGEFAPPPPPEPGVASDRVGVLEPDPGEPLEVALGPEADAPRLTGSRQPYGDDEVLVLRLLPPSDLPRPPSSGRAELRARLDQELQRRLDDPEHRPMVVTLEIANHELVHDSLGPSAAEAFLFRLEHRLAEVLAEPDRLARLDGPVFAVLMEASGPSDEAAMSDANAMAASIGAPCLVGDRSVQPVIKVGFALARETHVTADDMLRDAAIARRRSKAFRTRPAMAFVQSMHNESRMRLDLESALPGAAERGELELHYQPVVDLRSNRLRGFEALLRWRRDEGLLMPSQFVPIAEETGLIRALGLWVLKTGIAQVASWRAGRKVSVHLALNISPRQLGAPDLASRVEALLRHFRVPPTLLEVEVTESLLIEAPEAAARTMNGLRSLGVRTALDDFGTGYASLEQLHRYPFDVLKVDRYFVQRLPGGEADRRIIQTMKTLAGSLRMEMVAEGIETEAQAEFMRGLGCERGQGYLYGRAMLASDAARLIQRDPVFPLVKG